MAEKRNDPESYVFLSFEESYQKDFSQIGGKGFNLIHLQRSGFKDLVPDGFLISTEIFKEFLLSKIDEGEAEERLEEGGGLEPEIIELLGRIHEDNVSPDDIRDASVCISELILKHSKISTVVVSLEQSISKRIDGGEFYSVRSSGVAEDLADASFAGQMETFLNVKGSDTAGLVESIVKCWCSAFSPRALTYRKVNGFEIQSIPYMCVIVQKMVKNVKSAGVLFTSHPISSRRDLMLINCSFGLGEAIVSGRVNCDSFEVEKPKSVENGKFRISFKNIASKGVQIISLGEGRTEEEDIDEEQRTKPCISEEVVRELAKTGALIEKSYNGVPQDIEFAIDTENRIFILQSRPITNLQPIPLPYVGYHEEEKLEEYKRLMAKYPRRVFLSMNNMQVISQPFSPLGATFLMESALSFVFSDSGLILPEEPWMDNSFRFVESRGRMYIDITDVVAHRILGKGMTKLIANGDMFVSKCIGDLIQRKYVKGDGVPTLSSKNLLRTFSKALKHLPSMMLLKPTFSSAESAEEDYRNRFDECIRLCKTALEVDDESRSEVEHIAAYLKETSRVLPSILSRIMPAMASFKFVERALKEKPDLLKRFLSGIFLDSKLMELSLHEISLVLKKHPKLLAKVIVEKENLSKLSTGEMFETVLKWEDIEGVQEFVDSIQRFLREYGSRGLCEIDIFNPRFRENLAFVINVALSNVDVDEESKEELIADSKKAEKEILEYIQNSGTWFLRGIRVKTMRNWLKWIRHVFQLRETQKMLMMNIFDEFRLLCVDIAHRVLIPKKILGCVKDVYFLYLRELVHILKNIDAMEVEEVQDVCELVKARKEKYARETDKHAAKILTDQGEDVEETVRRLLTKDLPENVMLGEGVSSGIVKGPVKVILDAEKDTMPNGHILVSKMIDPSFSALFKNCIGMISSVGGQLTHGSVVAREMGIPAVVGVFDCTNLLKDGDYVIVDGSAGTVEKCDAPKNDGSLEGTQPTEEIEIMIE